MTQKFYLEFSTDDHMQAFINAGVLADLEPADTWLTSEPVTELIMTVEEQAQILREQAVRLESFQVVVDDGIDQLAELRRQLDVADDNSRAQQESMRAQALRLKEMMLQLETTEAVRDQYERTLRGRDQTLRQLQGLLNDQDKMLQRIASQRDRLVASVGALTEIIEPSPL